MPCKVATVALATLLTSLTAAIPGAAQSSIQYPSTQSTSGPIPAAQPYDPAQQQDIQPAQVVPDDPNTPDPALANIAPASHVDYPADQPSDPAPSGLLQSDGSYQQPAAVADDNTLDAQADQPPPALFDYDQPFAPSPYSLWVPGYWAHNRIGFFWVPGQWSRAPFIGALWTPPYWGFTGETYRFHPGYWGTHIGYYGGVNYCFGYIGTGFYGGYWRGNEFFYNTAVARVPSTIATVYNHTTIFHGTTYSPGAGVRASYSGGPGGLRTRPTTSEIVAAHELHLPETRSQVLIRNMSSRTPEAAFNNNQGHPVRVVMVPRVAVGRPSITASIAPLPASIQDAQLLETQRQERLQRMHQQMDALRAAGESITGISSGVSTMPPSQSGSTSLPSLRRIPPGQARTTSTTSTSSTDRTSSQTTTRYESPQSTTHYEPRPPANPVSTAHDEPTATHTETRPEPVRTEPVRVEPVRVEPVRTEPVATNPVEPIAHTTEPIVHSEPTGRPAEQTAHPPEPTVHVAPAQHPAPPPPRTASH